jgi:hypothetical protein
MDSHIASTANPHAVTAAQVAAIPDTGWIDLGTALTAISIAYTNDPAAGSNITLNVADTSYFVVYDYVRVSSSAGAETARINAIVANTSITVDVLTLNHTTTTPLIIPWLFAISPDVSATVKRGHKLKFTQGAAARYFTISSCSSTLLKVIPSEGYPAISGAITVPYYSNIDFPTGWPEWFSWKPTITGFSTAPVGGIYRYKVFGGGHTVTIHFREIADGTSNATTYTYSLPIQSLNSTGQMWAGVAAAVDNSVPLSDWSRISVPLNAVVADCYPLVALASAWTAANGKRIGVGEVSYEI